MEIFQPIKSLGVPIRRTVLQNIEVKNNIRRTLALQLSFALQFEQLLNKFLPFLFHFFQNRCSFKKIFRCNLNQTIFENSYVCLFFNWSILFNVKDFLHI